MGQNKGEVKAPGEVWGGGGDCWEIALSSDYLMKQGFPHFRVLLTFSSALTNISAKY